MAYATGRAFRELGEGLRGIGQTAGDVSRRRAEEERQRRLDEQRQQQIDLRTDLTLSELGGGRGDVPSFDVPTELPTLGQGKTQTATMEDPTKQAVGGIGYITRPEIRERQEYGLGQERAAAERERMIGAIGAGRGSGAAGFVEGLPGSIAFPEPDQPDDVNWQTIETADGFVQVNPRTGETRPLGYQGRTRATEDRAPITLSQALDQVYALYADPVTGEMPLSQQEQYELATQMVSGEGVQMPTISEPEMLPEPGLAPEPEEEPGFFSRMRDMMVPGAPMEGPMEPSATQQLSAARDRWGGGAAQDTTAPDLMEPEPEMPTQQFDVAGALGATPVDTIPPEQIPTMVQQWAAEGVPREEVRQRLAEMGYR